MNDQIEQLLVKGIEEKEKKHFSEADKLFTEAIILSEKNHYLHGFLHGLLNKGTIWKILARDAKSDNFAYTAQSYFTEALAFALRNGMPEEESIHVQFLLGQAEYQLRNYESAVSLYREAFEYYLEHQRSKAHTGDIKRHLGTTLIAVGKYDEGLQLLIESLQDIRTFDDSYAFANRVWEAGALLSLAKAYSDSEPEKAKAYGTEALQLAKEYKLIIREGEAEEFLQQLTS